jgi:bacillolysin
MTQRVLSAGVCALVIALGGYVAAQAPAGPAAVGRRPIAVAAGDVPALRAWDSTIEAMRRSGGLVLRRTRTDTLLRGRTHERFDQFVNGLRVVGGHVTRQTANGVTVSILGALQDVGDIPARPRLSESEIRGALPTLDGRLVLAVQPLELVYYPDAGGRYDLAYSTRVWTRDGLFQTYLDADSGRVLHRYSDLRTQSAVGTGNGVLGDRKKISTQSRGGRFVADDALRPPTLVTYDFRGDWQQVDDYLFGFYTPTSSDIASDSDNSWTDGANVDAHVYLGWTYDYFYKRFGRLGLDDRNAPIYAVTHPVNRGDWLTVPEDVFVDFFLNAFWCSGCGPDGRGAMVFGEGLPAGLTPGGFTVDYFAGALDVVAHELTHGLTEYTSDLIYEGESGALNESFSDIMGTSAEFFFQTPGSGPLRADYRIGEDIYRPGGFRSMSDPGLFGDPDHYSQRFTGSADNGGVHTNSGISNQAFYLAIEGGTNRTSGLTVTGVGSGNRQEIEKVFYRAFAFLLPPNADFASARAATLQAARDLYGAGSRAENAVAQAGTAVGVN